MIDSVKPSREPTAARSLCGSSTLRCGKPLAETTSAPGAPCAKKRQSPACKESASGSSPSFSSSSPARTKRRRKTARARAAVSRQASCTGRITCCAIWSASLIPSKYSTQHSTPAGPPDRKRRSTSVGSFPNSCRSCAISSPVFSIFRSFLFSVVWPLTRRLSQKRKEKKRDHPRKKRRNHPPQAKFSDRKPGGLRFGKDLGKHTQPAQLS